MHLLNSPFDKILQFYHKANELIVKKQIAMSFCTITKNPGSLNCPDFTLF